MRCARRLRTFVPLLALLSAPGALADEEQAPPGAESSVPPAPKVDVTGFVDVFYGYNFNRADPAFRAFDVQHNAFSLSLAEVAFAEKVTPENRLGFRVDLGFGKTADLVAALEPEQDGREIYKHFQQAYLSLLTGKVQWDVGRFVTPIGAEVIESQDNWNYTRSILFGYAIPFNHTGVRAVVTPNDRASFTVFLLNGWNNGSDLGGDKTVAASAMVKPVPPLTCTVNYMAGREVEGGDTRGLLDATVSYAVTSRLSLMGNVDYGSEGDVKWWGLATYARLQVRPEWSLAGRFEWLDDTRGGFMLLGTKARTLTLTSDHLVAGGLKARLEYRTDFADAAVFPHHDGIARKSQTTVTAGLVYGFNRSF